MTSAQKAAGASDGAIDLTQEHGGVQSLAGVRTPSQRPRPARQSLDSLAAGVASAETAATSYQDALSGGSNLSPSAREGLRQEVKELDDAPASFVTVLQSRGRQSIKVDTKLLAGVRTVKAFLHIIQAVALSTNVDWPSGVGSDLGEGECWLDDRKGPLTDARLAEEGLQPNSMFRLLRESDRGHPEGMKFSSDSMYNLIPKAGVLTRSSTQYTFYTAIAELVDNCLQAIWMETLDTARRVNIVLTETSIEITDSGCGMDEQQIKSWGTVGDSRNIAVHDLSTKVPPPFRLPYIGKYGVGAKAACFHLGRAAKVESKKRGSKQVTELKLDMDKLEESQWLAAGSVNKDPAPNQVPFEGFTRVTITKLNKETCTFDRARLESFLKDVYHKYLLPTHEVADESAEQREQGPVSIAINGVDLNEDWNSDIQKTVALGNFQEKGGPLIVDLEFSRAAVSSSSSPAAASTSTGQTVSATKARARMELFYLPFKDGEEQLESTLAANPDPGATFATAWRTAFCWLARWLPDANQGPPGLPFQRLPARNQRANEPPPTAMNRVRGIIYLDGGFTPSETKTTLAVDKPFNKALLMLGERTEVVAKTSAKGVKVKIKVRTVGRSGELWEEVDDAGKLAKRYRVWVGEQHRLLDDEVKCDDESKMVVLCDDQLRTSLGGIDAETVTFLKRVEIPVENGVKQLDASAADGPQQLRVKFGKGPSFATIEWFLYPGMDEPSDIRFVYRIHDRNQPDERRSQLVIEKGDSPKFRPNEGCKIAHVNQIITGEFIHVTPAEWAKMVQNEEASLPGYVDILLEDEVAGEKGFPPDGAVLEAGEELPNAGILVRPRTESKGGRLARPNIVQKPLEVRLDVLFKNTAGELAPPFSHRLALVWPEAKTKIKGSTYFFTFPPNKGKPYLWEAGTYTFTFLVEGEHNPPVKPLVRNITVRPGETVGKWMIAGAADGMKVPVGTLFNLRIHQEDTLGNRKAFDAPLRLRHKFFTASLPYTAIEDDQILLKHPSAWVSRDNMELEVDHLVLTTKLTPVLREVFLRLMPASNAEVFRAVVSDRAEEEADANKAEIHLTLEAGPGCPENCSLESDALLDGATSLRPDQVLETCLLVFQDQFGNPLERGTEVTVDLDGFEAQGNRQFVNQTDEKGQIDLGGKLTVCGAYGSTCKIVASQGDNVLLSKEAKVAELHIHLEPEDELSGVAAGSLDDVVMTLVDPDGNAESDVEGSWAFVLEGVPLPKGKKPLGRTFDGGRADLKGVVLPKRVGLVNGQLRVTVRRGGLRTELEMDVKIRVRAGPVQKLESVPLPEPVPCGGSFKLAFVSLDANKLAAPLADDIRQRLQLVLDGEPQENGDLTDASQPELVGASINEYELNACLEGAAGTYILKLSSTKARTGEDPTDEAEPETQLIAKWKVRLCAGEVDKLEARSQDAPVTTTVAVCRGNWLQGLTVLAQDAQENECVQLDREKCILEIAPVGVDFAAAPPDQCKSWAETMRRGKITFKKLRITLPIGKYHVTCRLENAPDKTAAFRLRVAEGNYPRKLKLPDKSPVVFGLGTESGPVLPTQYVDILAADGCRLRSLEGVKLPVLNIKRHDTGEVVGGPFTGQLQVENDPGQERRTTGTDDGAGPSENPSPAKRARTAGPVKKEEAVKREGDDFSHEVTRFVFTDVPIPTTAGEYVLEFSHTHEYNLGSNEEATKTRVRPLEIRHGLPAKLHFAARMRETVAEGEELVEAGRSVGVLLRDAHKNVCASISGLHVALYVSGDGSADVPGLVVAEKAGPVEAVLLDGRAEFGAVRMGPGGMGIYSFACGIAQSEVEREESKEWVKRVKKAKSSFVYRNPEEEGHVLEAKEQLMRALRDAKEKEGNLQASLERLEAELQTNAQRAQACAAKRAKLESARAASTSRLAQGEREARYAAGRIRELERAQPAGPRNTREVMQEFRQRRPWAAAAQQAVESPGSGLHPDDFRRRNLEPELLGVVAFLGRAEDDTLNARLMEWVGGKKDSVVCRTEEGRAAYIDVRSPDGSIDLTRGLAAFARQNNLSPRGRYDVIPLDKPGVVRNFYTGPIDEDHEQKLLNLDDPSIRGQRPAGFLGYAVNLIHLSAEQLEMEICVPFGNRVRKFGLRASLFDHLFGRLQVYDTDAHKRAAAREVQQANFCAVTIGPGSISRPDREVSGFAPEGVTGVSFERVPWSERRHCSLYPPELSQCLRITDEYGQLEN